MITTDEIKRRLWDGANELRGSMDAGRYKDYMLGLMFYKFLSDKTINQFKILNGITQATEKEAVLAYANAKKQIGDRVEKMIQQVLGYYVSPEYLYQAWLADINSGDFEVQKVTDSLNHFERTINITRESDDFKGLFSGSTLDLSDTALGGNLNERSKNIKSLILLFADLDMVSLQKGDVLGDAYEYLIGQFAMESGKKAGEFYTPRQVSEVMAQIVAKSGNIKTIYDPTVGSGSLLLTVSKHLSLDNQKDLNYYGQEKNTATYNLTRMNLLLHGVRPEKMSVKNGDTLAQDWPEDPERPNEGVQFDAVVMNPPYSVKNWNRSGLKVSDPRFDFVGTLPPDSKGDFAFLLHGLYHLRTTGTMAIVLPHGVLFRGGAEGEIRKRLIDKNYIDAVIGLPSNLFTNTGIPVVVIVLKKNRNLEAPILLIDGSKNFIKVGKQNVLQEKDTAKIVDTYLNAITDSNNKGEKGYSHLATRKEIIENEYNLNIPRYIEAITEEIPHDVGAHLYGGIPKDNLMALHVLQAFVPDVLKGTLEEKRKGYFYLTKPIEELTDRVMTHKTVLDKENEVRLVVEQFIHVWWDKLKKASEGVVSVAMMEEMLMDIKNDLKTFKTINIYDGFQIVAQIWKDSLSKDLEIIRAEGFYKAGRTRVPNIVTKGSGDKKREEQDGWMGSIVPNDLIGKNIFKDQIKAIETAKDRVQTIEGELSEIIENAKAEESDDTNILADTLNEAQDSFDSKKLKAELKNAKKGSKEYETLKQVDDLLTEKATLNKEVKALEIALKEAIEERILSLTDEEIDNLMLEKWFGGVSDEMVALVSSPLKKELDTLKTLDGRYADTLVDLDNEIEELEKSFEMMLGELEVTE